VHPDDPTTGENAPVLDDEPDDDASTVVDADVVARRMRRELGIPCADDSSTREDATAGSALGVGEESARPRR
jgi:hypothetical protein